jgi:hypothetical protein
MYSPLTTSIHPGKPLMAFIERRASESHSGVLGATPSGGRGVDVEAIGAIVARWLVVKADDVSVSGLGIAEVVDAPVEGGNPFCAPLVEDAAPLREERRGDLTGA